MEEGHVCSIYFWMRSLLITRHGGPEVLQLREGPSLSPSPGEVLVQVARAGLNFSDVSARVGLYPDAPPPPVVMGYEVAGTVAGLGSQVTGFREGDRVLALTRFHGQAEQVSVPARQVRLLPEKMSFEDAAALPVNFLTAFHMLFFVAHPRPGAKVLIHQAAGGVGLALVQLCRQVEGVELFGTASAAKHALLRQEGVHHPIDYHCVDYARSVRKLTSGRGVDLVLDPLGGKDWRKGYGLLRPGGQLVCFGWSSMIEGERRSWLEVTRQLAAMPLFTPLKLMNDNRSVSGVNMGRLWNEEELLGGHLDRLLELYRGEQIHPRVDRTFHLTEGPQAHRYLQERRNIGKVLFDCTVSH